MDSFSKRVQQYNKRFGVNKSYEAIRIAPETKVCLVIPCYDEDPQATLKSLGNCENPGHTEVVLVFNHGKNADEGIKRKHEQQAKFFNNFRLDNDIEVKAIRAFDLPPKHAGVGLARKIGMDVVLNAFESIGYDGLLICLDADCTVSANYLLSMKKAERSGVNGCSIYFEHPLENLSSQKCINIGLYEIFLRAYVQALRFSHYSNAFHTVGSSMGVRSSVYAKIGGMNRRKAGEDFYFLHKLIPQGAFHDLTECTVFPSSRISYRVPFGTGRAMSEMANGIKDFKSFYNNQTFKDLQNFNVSVEDIYSVNKDIPKTVKAFLQHGNLYSEWEDLKLRSTNTKQFVRNFNFWWDGFKVLKYVHFVRDHFYPNQSVLEVTSKLFGQNFTNTKDCLDHLRMLDQSSIRTTQL